MWRTPATLDGHARRRARTLGPHGAGVILAIETSCDDTCAAVVDARRRDPLERHLLAGRPRPLRRRRARGRLAPPPRAGQRGRRRRAAPRRRRRSTTSSWSPSPRARASSARCSSASRRPRRWPPRAACRWPPVDHLQGHVAANFLAPATAVRAAVPVPDRLAAATRSSPASTTHDGYDGPRPRRSTTPPARRSTRARACSACRSRAARPSAPRRGGRPGRVRVPDRRAASPGLDFSLLRAEDGAALHGARPRRGGARAPPGRPRRLLPARDRRGARAALRARARADRPASALAIGGGVAANGPLRERLARARRRRLAVPPRELCTDNAAMIAARRALRRAARRSPATSRSTPTRRRARTAVSGRRPLRPPRLPPLRRRARGPASGSAQPFDGGRHRGRRRAARAATWSASRWSTLDGEELFDFFVDEDRTSRGRLA